MSDPAPLSALDRIKAAMAAKQAAAAAAPPPTVEATAEVVKPATAAPAAEVKTLGQMAAASGVKVETEAPAASTTTALSTELVEVADDEAAAKVLAVFLGGGPAPSGVVTLSDVGEATEAGGGVRHSHPFCQIKQGNWETHKSAQPAVFENMPVGNREFRAIYLGHRLGMTSWAGGSTKGGGGSPPLWAAVVPTMLVHKGSLELSTKILHIGSRVQYTKRDQRAKFDTVGRLTPELQVLMWTPATGYFVAVTPGYKATQASLVAIKKIQEHVSGPVFLRLDKEVEENKKATNPDAKEWDVFFAAFDLCANEQGMALLTAFTEVRNRDPQGVANAVLKFHRGDDYDGLKLPELTERVKKYAPLI